MIEVRFQGIRCKRDAWCEIFALMDVPSGFQPIMASQYENFQTKGAVMRKHLTPDKISQSHANKSCCPERQNLSNDEGDEEVVTENDYVKSQLYSILK